LLWGFAVGRGERERFRGRGERGGWGGEVGGGRGGVGREGIKVGNLEEEEEV